MATACPSMGCDKASFAAVLIAVPAATVGGLPDAVLELRQYTKW